MDETQTQQVQTVFVLEESGCLTGPFTSRPGAAGSGQTVHETAGRVHAFDRDRDWFECPWCHDEVTGEQTAGHDCGESTLDR